MVLKWTRTKPEPLKYFEQELNLNLENGAGTILVPYTSEPEPRTVIWNGSTPWFYDS